MKKSSPSGTPRNKGNMKYIVFIAILVIASFSITWLFLSAPIQEGYSVQNGVLSYTGRPQIEYGQEVWNESDDVIIYRVWFPSHGGVTVYGLLAVPKLDGPLPAFFILPGATVTKEGVQGTLGRALNEMGYVTLSLDQRSHGETLQAGGELLSFEDDYLRYNRGEEATHHMAVYDGLRAFDLLYQLPGLDRSRLYAAGESMGGNYAMVAAGIEPRISGLLLVSSSGFRFFPQSDPGFAGYLSSVSGLNYLDKLSPRPLLMLHNETDSVVSLEDAMETFSLAGEPKEFLTTDKGGHSYDPGMRDILEQGLGGW